MSKLPNFWQFFNLTSQPAIPSLYWDSYSYEERIKKICDKIWAILNYLKLVMELMNEFDDRLTALEELYNALEARVTTLEREVVALKERVTELEGRVTDLEERVTEIERQIREIYELIAKVNNVIAPEYNAEESYEVDDFVMYEDNLYRCIASTSGEFDANSWAQTQVGPELSALIRAIDDIPTVNTIYHFFAPTYDETETYNEGDLCIYDGEFYIANTDITTAEAFDSTHWDMTSVDNIYKLLLNKISQSTGDSPLNLKFADPEQANPNNFISKFAPLQFGSDQEYDASDPSVNTDPFHVQGAPIGIANLSDIFSNNDHQNPYANFPDTIPMILLNSNNLKKITVNGADYIVKYMICKYQDTSWAFCYNSTTKKNYIFFYEQTNGWQAYIGNFVEAADAATAASLSASNPNIIYYVVET